MEKETLEKNSRDLEEALLKLVSQNKEDIKILEIQTEEKTWKQRLRTKDTEFYRSKCTTEKTEDKEGRLRGVIRAEDIQFYKSGGGKRLEKQHREIEPEVSIFLKDQLLGKGRYTEVEKQTVYEREASAFCYTAALSAWDKVEETGKRLEPFIQII